MAAAHRRGRPSVPVPSIPTTEVEPPTVLARALQPGHQEPRRLPTTASAWAPRRRHTAAVAATAGAQGPRHRPTAYRHPRRALLGTMHGATRRAPAAARMRRRRLVRPSALRPRGLSMRRPPAVRTRRRRLRR